MNVMLTCAGRRSYCVEFFKQAVGDQSRVFACDSSADAPAFQKADKAFVVPRIDDEDYIDALLAICDDHQIGLLVPALEPELLLLAEHRARFLAVGTVPLVSPPGDRCYLLQQIGGCYVIDINPRFGGGYPFSHIAGANLPAALIAWGTSREPDPAWFRVEPNVAASRYDSLFSDKTEAARHSPPDD
jgi:hypothetical protein